MCRVVIQALPGCCPGSGGSGSCCVPTVSRWLHGGLLPGGLNENASTNPSGFPTRATKKVTYALSAESPQEVVRGAVEVLLQNTERWWCNLCLFQWQLLAPVWQGSTATNVLYGEYLLLYLEDLDHPSIPTSLPELSTSTFAFSTTGLCLGEQWVDAGYPSESDDSGLGEARVPPGRHLLINQNLQERTQYSSGAEVWFWTETTPLPKGMWMVTPVWGGPGVEGRGSPAALLQSETIKKGTTISAVKWLRDSSQLSPAWKFEI